MADPVLQLEGGRGAFEGLTMNVEFYEDNSGSAQKMRFFRKKKGGGGGAPLDPPLGTRSGIRKSQYSQLL